MLPIVIYVVIILLVVGAAYMLTRPFSDRSIIWLASFDTWWSPYRLYPPEGEMYIVVSGTPEGPFDGIIESVPDHNYDEKKMEFEPDPVGPGPKDNGHLASIGVARVGFNKYLLMREVKYDKWEQLANSENWGLVPKNRPGPSIYFQYFMATRIEGAETKGNFPVDAVVTFSIQVLSPIKALFFAGGFESQATAAVQGAVREYIGTRTIEELRAEKAAQGTDNLIKKIMGIDLSHIGIKIVNATFVKYDLETGDQEANAAVRAKEVARLKGEADVEAADARIKVAAKDAEAAIKTAEGEKRRREIIAQGIQTEYAARVQAGKEHAGAFALAEAIATAKPNAIGGDILTSILPKGGS